MNNRINLIRRWQRIIRACASEYEHKARAEGKIVSQPSLDEIANEMEAYLAGLVEIDIKTNL